jgi:hypothetical protein
VQNAVVFLFCFLFLRWDTAYFESGELME